MTPFVLRLSYTGVLNFLHLSTVKWADILILADRRIGFILGPTSTKEVETLNVFASDF